MLAARREEIDWVYSEGVHESVPMQKCRDAGMKPLDLICLDTDKSVGPTGKKNSIEVGSKRIQNEEAR